MPSPGAATSEKSLLRTLIDHIPDVVYMKDQQSRFVAANLAMAKLFNLSKVEELYGKTDFDFCPKKLAAEYFRDEQRLLETGEAITSKEEVSQSADGKPQILMVTKTPLRDEKGNIVGLVGIGRDVTEITVTRQKLKQQSLELQQRNTLVDFEREQLQTLIDNIPDFIYFKDRESRYLNGNNKFYHRFNASCIEEIIGKQDSDLLGQEDAQRFYDDEVALFETGETLTKEELSKDKHGKTIVLHTTKTPIVDKNSQKIIGLVGISRDITEIKAAREELTSRAEALHRQKEDLTQTLDQLKQAQSQLVQSEKMASLGVLTAGIAHEINNPINFVYAGVNSMGKDFEDVKAVVAQLRLLSQAQDPAAAIAKLEETRKEVYFDEAFEALEETLKDIKLGATRITEIVAGLSKFSRLGKEDWQLSNLHEDLESVLVLLKNKYKTHIKIERDFAPDLPSVVCFPGKLNQAFMNIISNAIDAIDAHSDDGTIRISTRATDASVFITIADTGTGMDESVRSKIFDPFFTTKSIGKGTGLGLSITYSIIQDHQGSLHLTTEPGKGSAFIIELPIEQETNKTQIPKAKSS